MHFIDKSSNINIFDFTNNGYKVLSIDFQDFSFNKHFLRWNVSLKVMRKEEEFQLVFFVESLLWRLF